MTIEKLDAEISRLQTTVDVLADIMHGGSDQQALAVSTRLAKLKTARSVLADMFPDGVVVEMPPSEATPPPPAPASPAKLGPGRGNGKHAVRCRWEIDGTIYDDNESAAAAVPCSVSALYFAIQKDVCTVKGRTVKRIPCVAVPIQAVRDSVAAAPDPDRFAARPRFRDDGDNMPVNGKRLPASDPSPTEATP